MMRKIAAILVCGAALASVHTDAWAVGRNKERRSEPPPLGMVTGPKTGTYIAIGRDIAKVAAESGLTLDVKESGGSIDNIKRIHSEENAALGIVQSDVLGFLSRSKNPDSLRISGNLRMVAPLYGEEVHVLARKDITKFEELRGKRVVVGEEGSGNMLTAVNLFSLMGITPGEMYKTPPPEGLVMLLKNDADAMIFVGGKPVKLFKNLEDIKSSTDTRYANLLAQLHFLPLADPKMLAEYRAAEIVPGDYDFVAERVPTLGVTAVLVTFDFSGAKRHQQRCQALRKLGGVLASKLETLKTSGHPKWKEVDIRASLVNWKRDACAWPNAQPTLSEEDSKQLEQDLIHIITKEDAPADKPKELPRSEIPHKSSPQN